MYKSSFYFTPSFQLIIHHVYCTDERWVPPRQTCDITMQARVSKMLTFTLEGPHFECMCQGPATFVARASPQPCCVVKTGRERKGGLEHLNKRHTNTWGRFYWHKQKQRRRLLSLDELHFFLRKTSPCFVLVRVLHFHQTKSNLAWALWGGKNDGSNIEPGYTPLCTRVLMWVFYFLNTYTKCRVKLSLTR